MCLEPSPFFHSQDDTFSGHASEPVERGPSIRRHQNIHLNMAEERE